MTDFRDESSNGGNGGGDAPQYDYDIQERYLAEINRYPLLTKDQEQALAKRVAEGDEEAKRRLVLSNLRLVVTIAKRYLGQGLGFLDIIEEGNMGLIRAAGKFDYRKGFRFSTYASWWIKQSMTRAIATHSKSIRIPVHIYQLINRYVKMEEQLAGKDHNEETLALRLGITIEKARMIRNLIHGIRSEDPMLSAEALQKLTVEHGREPSADLEEIITFQIENERVRSLIEKYLSKREQEILRIRYGLDDGKHKTLAETGKIMGVSRERIRQIEKRALRKLKIMMVSPRQK